MDLEKLYNIIQDSTEVFRKGAIIGKNEIENIKVKEIYGYKHTNESPIDENFDKIDMVFVDIVVNKKNAKKYEKDLIAQLNSYPQPDRLASGPSYIELAGAIGIEQEGVLRLMALGKVLELWNIVSGKTIGIDEATAKEMAGQGFLMISGYKAND